MLTLAHGIKQPQTGDTGETFFPALEDNAEFQAEVLSNTATVAAASWGSDLGGGTYRQTITLPTALTASPRSFTFDDIDIDARLSTGEKAYPTIAKVSSTTFYIYTNDNTIAYKLFYGV